MGAGVEPHKAAAHDFDTQAPTLHVNAIDVSNLKLASAGRLNRLGNIEYFVIVKVEPRYREIGTRLRRLFNYRQWPACRIEFDHAVEFRIRDDMGEDRGTARM